MYLKRIAHNITFVICYFFDLLRVDEFYEYSLDEISDSLFSLKKHQRWLDKVGHHVMLEYLPLIKCILFIRGTQFFWFVSSFGIFLKTLKGSRQQLIINIADKEVKTFPTFAYPWNLDADTKPCDWLADPLESYMAPIPIRTQFNCLTNTVGSQDIIPIIP